MLGKETQTGLKYAKIMLIFRKKVRSKFLWYAKGLKVKVDSIDLNLLIPTFFCKKTQY